MTQKEILVVGMDGGRGVSGLLMIDSATGATLREPARQQGNTDRIRDMLHAGNYLYTVDQDSSLVCYDLDNVFQARVDIGYDERVFSMDGGRPLMEDGNGHIFYIKANREFGVGDPTDNQAWKLVRRDAGTLANPVATVLSDPSCWDADTNTQYCAPKIWHRDATGFWLATNSPAVNGGAGAFIKIGWSGALLDTWVPELASNYSVQTVIWDDGKVLFVKNADPTTATFAILDFAAKAQSADYGPYDYYTPFGAAYPTASLNAYTLSNLAFGRMQARFTGSAFVIPSLVGVTATDVHGVINPNGMGVVFATIQLTGEVSYGQIAVMESYDAIKQPDSRFVNSLDIGIPLSNGDWLVGSRRELFKVNEATGAVWTYTPTNGLPQSYSSDGAEYSSVFVIHPTALHIPGTITDTAGSLNRQVMLYDEASGELIASTVASGGTYSVECYSSSKKFAICRSKDNAKNMEVRAHLTPTPA